MPWAMEAIGLSARLYLLCYQPTIACLVTPPTIVCLVTNTCFCLFGY